MTRILVSFILILISSIVSAQDFYASFRTKYFQNENTNEYNKLLERFRNSDSTLTMDDFRDLYYASAFLPSYQPEKINEVEERIREANFKKDYTKAIQLSDSLLAQYPVSIQAYFEKSWAYHNLEKSEEEVYNNKRYKILIKAILTSGDGKSLDSAFHTNLPNDEFEVIKFLGLDIKEETEVSYNGKLFDVFYVKPNKAKVKNIYFDVSKQRRP